VSNQERPARQNTDEANKRTLQNEKSARRDANTARCVVTRSQKISLRHRPPSRGRRTAKIKSAGDGHYLHLQTQFGEDRCTQFRVIVITDTARGPHARPRARYRQDRLQYTAPLASAQCKYLHYITAVATHEWMSAAWSRDFPASFSQQHDIYRISISHLHRPSHWP